MLELEKNWNITMNYAHFLRKVKSYETYIIGILQK